ncbi:histone deacetylase family protein [Bradyrhizobium sp. BRP14]|nr:histone deacetylase family protein [Bradyrhizobium sp. BRP14]
MNFGKVEPAADLPERTARLLSSLSDSGIPVLQPHEHGLEPILKVHDRDYVSFLKSIWSEWEALPKKGPVAWPSYFPYSAPLNGRSTRGPCPTQALKGRLGWYLGDMSAPVGPHTFRSAVKSAETAVSAADALLQGERVAYALCRPSGHHARVDRASGLCYFNNSAIAAERLLTHYERVAILDVDVHQGDGAEQIFYERKDVFTVSIHADPIIAYPFFTGFKEDSGRGQGEGFNLNVPLAARSGLPQYQQALEVAIEAILNFSPDGLIIGLGFDAHEADPIALMSLVTQDFRTIGERIGLIEKPTLVVQEGGYGIDVIGGCLTAFLEGLCG